MATGVNLFISNSSFITYRTLVTITIVHIGGVSNTNFIKFYIHFLI